tara:strand:- start:22489 stop:23211 length:723 start_codon:yes stop_codon:yes gene_type:complete
MKLLGRVFLVVVLLSSAIVCFADNKLITENISKAIPGLIIKDIQSTQIKGMFQVESDSGEILFSSSDGRYFFTGDMYSTENDKLKNLSETKREVARISKINTIPNDQKIVFPAEGEQKGSITVFTDIDCGYCRKLHKEVPELNAMGVKVSYLAYPRAGINSESYKKYVSVWCADDKLTAMTKAKNGQPLDVKVCANPVADQYNLGRKIGISGTPAIILEDGTLIPGYINAAKIGQALGIL